MRRWRGLALGLVVVALTVTVRSLWLSMRRSYRLDDCYAMYGAGSASRGEAIWLNYCASCHDFTERPMGPLLRESLSVMHRDDPRQAWDYIVESVFYPDAVDRTSGDARMPYWSELTAQQVADIATYVCSTIR